MSDVVKWGLLVAGIVAMLAIVLALPFVQYIDATEFGNAVGDVISVCGDSIRHARCIINNFLSPFGRELLTGVLYYLFGKWAITLGVKITAWVYHFVFK